MASLPGFADVVVDENCHGTQNVVVTLPPGSPMPCSFRNDPGPGGLPNVMTYEDIIPTAQQGDLLIIDPLTGLISDVVRFNGDGTLIFYSDNSDGSEDLADTGLPTSFYTNFLRLTETSLPGGGDGVVYHALPQMGMPGSDGNRDISITYVIQSDSAVPEPVAFFLVFGGLGVLAA